MEQIEKTQQILESVRIAKEAMGVAATLCDELEDLPVVRGSIDYAVSEKVQYAAGFTTGLLKCIEREMEV